MHFSLWIKAFKHAKERHADELEINCKMKKLYENLHSFNCSYFAYC